MLCEICNKEFDSFKALGGHLKRGHKIDLSSYYDDFIKKDEHEGFCKTCKKPTKFLSLREGYAKFCSTRCSTINPETQEKSKLTKIKKHGSLENAWKIKSEKIKQNRNYTNESLVKFHKTCFDRYGISSPMKSEEFKKRLKNSLIEKYGVNHNFKIDNVKEQRKETFLKNYGVDNPLKCKEIVNKVRSSIRNKKSFGHFFTFLKENDFEPLFNEIDFYDIEKPLSFRCNLCGEIKQLSQPSEILVKCFCRGNFVSKLEDELYDFLIEKLNDFKIERSKRDLIKKREIDLYIPDKKIGIEINGLYWHTEISGMKSKKYHLEKTELCNKEDIQLLHLFDFEWKEKKEIIKSIILSKLGIYETRLPARKCEVKEIDSKIKNQFLKENHLQGDDKSSIKLGLFFDDKLISVMTFGKRSMTGKIDFELIRYCVKKNTTVLGGAQKLFSYFKRNYPEIKEIKTYADRRWSTGKFYESLGFHLTNKSFPSYWYTKNYKDIYHRSVFMKHKLSKKLDYFNPNLTEWENMKLNGWDRFWDCGTFVYKWSRDS